MLRCLLEKDRAGDAAASRFERAAMRSRSREWRLRWTCTSEQIEDRYLPQECRQGR